MLRSACFVLVLASSAAVSAQSMTPCAPGDSGGSSRWLEYQADIAPYTATTRTTFEQKLANGATIHRQTEAVFARNTKGDRLERLPMMCNSDSSGQPQLTISVNIMGRSESTRWIEGPGSLHEFDSSEFKGSDSSFKDIPRSPNITFPRHKLDTEDLGTRTIAGMDAHGTRTTEIIPIDTEGNDQPLTVVRETWWSTGNKLTLMTVEDDPRRGKSTWEVTSFTPGEPDAKLFTPPADYREIRMTSERKLMPVDDSSAMTRVPTAP